MGAKKHILVCAVSVVSSAAPVFGANPANTVEITRYENEYSRVLIEAARMGTQLGIVVVFRGTDDLHYYADSNTAPAPNLDLQIRASAEGLSFKAPVFPKRQLFHDLAQEKTIEVYVGDFEVFVPFEGSPDRPIDVTVEIAGLACTSQLCLPPFKKGAAATIDPRNAESWPEVSIAKAGAPQSPLPISISPPAQVQKAKTTRQAVLPYSTNMYFLLAALAGISINIMPCVLPVIPLIMARLIDQSKRAGGSRLATGIAFCAGVILFFAVFALVSAIINLTTGAVLDLNSLFRYPTAVIVLFLAIVFFGLAMLDVIPLSLPSSVTSRQSTAAGLAGTAGMGFFAAILSTPCSGALLGFVLVWAQTQPLSVSSTAIVLMGVGMALPYGIIVSIPSLLERIPKPGTWMEIFKKSTGFLLFFIAAKLTLAALPKERLLNVLMYGVIFSFCVWMWGKWVGFSTPTGKKWAVRLIALAIALGTGAWLLPAPPKVSIDWQSYDRESVRKATARERPVLLKFTADWCANCKVVEKRVYQDPQIAQLIETKNVLAIKADTTVIDYAATVDLKQVYGEAGNVPVTIAVLPNGDKERLRGIFDKQELIKILERLPEVKG